MLRIRQERLRRGWSLRDLAFRAAIDPATLSRLERGLLPAYPAWRRRLAVILKLSADQLFRETPEDARRGDEKKETPDAAAPHESPCEA